MSGGASRAALLMAAGVVAPVLEDVIWTSKVNVTEPSGNDLLKNLGGNAWNAGAVSTKAIQSGDGYVEVVLVSTSGYCHIGLSVGDTDQDFSDVDFAVNTFPAGTLRAWRNGVLKDAGIGSVSNGDTLRVAIEAGSVVIRRNGSLLFTFANSPSYPMLLDCSLNVQNFSRLNGAKIQGILA